MSIGPVPRRSVDDRSAQLSGVNGVNGVNDVNDVNDVALSHSD